jgi:hypothetical protein
MTIEYTLAELEAVSVAVPDRPLIRAIPSWGWFSRILLGGFLVAAVIGWVQDIHRVSALRAELRTAPVIVITKEEAWLRLHPRPAHTRVRGATIRSGAIPIPAVPRDPALPEGAGAYAASF